MFNSESDNQNEDVWGWITSDNSDKMDKYDNLGIIGEGSYGVVIKCKHKQSGQVRIHKRVKCKAKMLQSCLTTVFPTLRV